MEFFYSNTDLTFTLLSIVVSWLGSFVLFYGDFKKRALPVLIIFTIVFFVIYSSLNLAKAFFSIDLL